MKSLLIRIVRKSVINGQLQRQFLPCTSIHGTSQPNAPRRSIFFPEAGNPASEHSKLTIFPAVESLGRYDFASGGEFLLRVADPIQFAAIQLSAINGFRQAGSNDPMTISMTDYFRTRTPDRKKETRYINVINKDSCTSCNSCATVCPVDCIYEVVSPVPSESYHQIDTSRCIGCQMCYRSPNDSSEFYQLTICPWNAIDMLHNPNVKPDDHSVLEPYYRGSSTGLPWPKLEEYGYQLFLDGEVFLPASEEALHKIFHLLQEEAWMYSEEDNIRIVKTEAETGEGFVRYQATEEARDLLDCMYRDYKRIFMD